MLSAIVLAGGRSSRMGRPKALLDFGGEPLIVHVVGKLQPLFSDLVVVAAPRQELPELPAKIVHDVEAYQGPVGGISYGLEAMTGEAAFVTSCDAPFASLELISHLITLLPGHEVVVPRWEGRLQPLFAIYSRSVLPELRDQLQKGELRPVSLFDRVRTRVVSEDEIRRADPDGSSFINMNTPEEYAAALDRWGRARAACTVELFGVARMVAKARAITIEPGPDATCADIFAALLERVPALAGRVIRDDGTALAEGYACSVNGITVVRDPMTRIRPGDDIAIISADAGG